MAEERNDAPLIQLILVLAAGAGMALLDATFVRVAIHALSEHIPHSLSTIEWVATGYIFALASSVTVSGWAIAWSLGSLLFFRVIQGHGWAASR